MENNEAAMSVNTPDNTNISTESSTSKVTSSDMNQINKMNKIVDLATLGTIRGIQTFQQTMEEPNMELLKQAQSANSAMANIQYMAKRGLSNIVKHGLLHISAAIHSCKNFFQDIAYEYALKVGKIVYYADSTYKDIVKYHVCNFLSVLEFSYQQPPVTQSNDEKFIEYPNDEQRKQWIDDLNNVSIEDLFFDTELHEFAKSGENEALVTDEVHKHFIRINDLANEICNDPDYIFRDIEFYYNAHYNKLQVPYENLKWQYDNGDATIKREQLEELASIRDKSIADLNEKMFYFFQPVLLKEFPSAQGAVNEINSMLNYFTKKESGNLLVVKNVKEMTTTEKVFYDYACAIGMANSLIQGDLTFKGNMLSHTIEEVSSLKEQLVAIIDKIDSTYQIFIDSFTNETKYQKFQIVQEGNANIIDNLNNVLDYISVCEDILKFIDKPKELRDVKGIIVDFAQECKGKITIKKIDEKLEFFNTSPYPEQYESQKHLYQSMKNVLVQKGAELDTHKKSSKQKTDKPKQMDRDL